MAMQDFSFYLPIGWEHIISWKALDHILFMAALAVIFHWRQWREVLVLVTAFTIGHFLTLWLTVTGFVAFGVKWVEFFIPLTISVTAVSNLFPKTNKWSMNIQYALALGFGLIHGMGYANAIRFGLTEGQSLAWGLFGFNLGLELGQVFLVAVVLTLGSLAEKGGIKRSLWINIISVATLLIATQMAWERLPFTNH